MIQRIQSIFLALVILSSGVASWYFPVFYFNEIPQMLNQMLWLAIFFFVTMFLAFYSLLQFRKRKTQFMLNRLNLIINLALTFYVAYSVFTLENISTGTTAILPMIHVIFLSLANRYIQKDEKLVRAADRIR